MQRPLRQTDALRPDVMSFPLPVALQVRRPSVYFVYILLSTALRSFEAGMVASMMIAIKESLSLTYTLEGVVAASPDFGIVPSGIIAVFLFHFFAAFAAASASALDSTSASHAWKPRNSSSIAIRCIALCRD